MVCFFFFSFFLGGGGVKGLIDTNSYCFVDTGKPYSSYTGHPDR